MAEQTITEILSSLTSDVPRRIRLTLRTEPSSKIYTTVLHVLKETRLVRTATGSGPAKDFFTIVNNCITIQINDTYIQANSPAKACFDPLLESDPVGTPGRITTTDVLQILKTKLQLAQPTDPGPIRISDAAKINGVHVTPFNLLRGKRPIYEKYGYMNETLPAIDAAIAATRWGSVAAVASRLYEMITGGVKPSDDMPIQDVMTPISLDSERAAPLSLTILKEILKQAGLNYPHLYTLDTSSVGWTTWSNRIQIMNAELLPVDTTANTMPNMSGGGLRRARSLRNRRRRSTRSLTRGRGGPRVTRRRAQTARRAR
jgi:hypothetical protein